MSSFFKQLFPFMKVKKKKEFSYIIKDVDPNTIWDLVGELGDGSFGKVYKAQHKTENILAAAKVIEVNDENELEDFMVEIDILSEIKYKHIVGLHQTYYYNNKLWMMLEFCSGGALDDLMLEIERGLTEPEIKAVSYQLFEGLNVLHSNKVIHRDLKAGNLLLASDGNIKMADFGVSAKNKKTMQKRTTFIGTPYWMAPEVVVTETCKDDPYDYKADIWSAGVTIIELAQMVPPYHAMHPMRVLFKIPKADPPSLDDGNKWSRELKDFLACCVVKSPEMRSTAAELLKHPFLADGVDCKALKDLYNEAKAEVIEVIEDLPEDTEEKDNEGRLKSSGSFEYLLNEEEKDINKEKQSEKENEKEKEKGNEINEENEVFENKETKEVPKKEEKKVEYNEEKVQRVEDVSKETDNAEKVSEHDTAEDKSKDEDANTQGEQIPVVKDDQAKDTLYVKEPEETKKGQEPERSEDKKETTTIEEQTEIKDESKKDSSDKYSSRLDNILDKMEVSDKTIKETAGETKEDKKIEAVKDLDGESQSEEETPKTAVEKEEDKRFEAESDSKAEGDTIESTEEKKEEDEGGEEKRDDIPKETLKEVPIYIDESGDKTESKEDNKKQEENKEKGLLTNQGEGLKEFAIYSDNGDLPIVKKNEPNKLSAEQTTTDGKKLANGALLAAELSKEGVVKKVKEEGGEKHFKTLKRTRKFATEDGKIVTETTSRVVDVSGEDFKNALLKEQLQRKMNLRDMKVFQRQEQKQGMELMSKIRRQWEAQEQRFEQEIQDIEKRFEGELDNLSRNQKREIEKLEITQNADLRASSRKMRQDQEKELRKFKENLKEEGRKSKKDIDKLPRPQRKETWKRKKDELDVTHRQAEHEFLAMQQAEFEKFYKQVIDLHRQKMFEMEMQFLESKHERKRAHESEKWEMEYRHLNERHQLAKTQLKETFFLQRSQMLNRHQKEVEQHQHLTKLQDDEMKRRHEIERKRLPKIQRNEIKVKSQKYRKTLRDKKVSLEQEKDLMKEYEDEERKRARSEFDKMLLRQDLEAEELKNATEAALKELEQLQCEKRHMLMESETLKLKERDDKHNSQMMAWKAELGPRKKTLEEEFAREKREQQLFYARGGEGENPPNDLRVPTDILNRDSMDGSGGSQTGSQKTPDDTSSSTGSLEV